MIAIYAFRVAGTTGKPGPAGAVNGGKADTLEAAIQGAQALAEWRGRKVYVERPLDGGGWEIVATIQG